MTRLSNGTATRCPPRPRKPPTCRTTKFSCFVSLSTIKSSMVPIFSFLSLMTLLPITLLKRYPCATTERSTFTSDTPACGSAGPVARKTASAVQIIQSGERLRCASGRASVSSFSSVRNPVKAAIALSWVCEHGHRIILGCGGSIDDRQFEELLSERLFRKTVTDWPSRGSACGFPRAASAVTWCRTPPPGPHYVFLRYVDSPNGLTSGIGDGLP